MISLLRAGSLLVIVVGAIAACTSSAGPPSDNCNWPIDLVPSQLPDLHPEQACEILVVNGARTLRVEVAAVTACGTTECDTSCSSPDRQMSFAFCYRGGPGGAQGGPSR